MLVRHLAGSAAAERRVDGRPQHVGGGRLPADLDHHPRGAGQGHAAVRHAGVSARDPGRIHRGRGGDLRVRAAGAGRGCDGEFPLPAEGLMRRSALTSTLTFYLPLWAFLALLLFPFYWMLVTAVRPNKELYNLSLNQLWTSHPTLQHFQKLLFDTHFVPWLQNTMLIALGATVLALSCAVFAASAVQRLRFRRSGVIGVAIFLRYLVPPVILLIPLSRF